MVSLQYKALELITGGRQEACFPLKCWESRHLPSWLRVDRIKWKEAPLCFSSKLKYQSACWSQRDEDRRAVVWSVCCVSGWGGDQHSASGSVSQRETRLRAEEETWPQPTQRTQAEHHQELARCTDLQRVRINHTGSIKLTRWDRNRPETVLQIYMTVYCT